MKLYLTIILIIMAIETVARLIVGTGERVTVTARILAFNVMLDTGLFLWGFWLLKGLHQ